MTNGDPADPLRQQFQAVYLDHEADVRRRVAARVRDHHVVEDVTQQIWCQAWRAWARYQETGQPVSHWLSVITLNACIDHARSRRDDDTAELLAEPSDPDRWTDPAWRAEYAEDVATLCAAIERLPHREAVALRMRLAEQSAARVAAALGTTPGNARVIHCRGVRALAQQRGARA